MAESQICRTGCFVAPSYRIMAENPAILAEIGHGGEPENRHRYLPWPIYNNTDGSDSVFPEKLKL